MGVNKFTETFKKHAPQGYLFDYPLEALTGKTLTIDMSYLIFAMKSTAGKQVVNETVLANEEPDLIRINRLTTYKILDRLVTLQNHKIEVICVFDCGHTDNLKSDTKQARKVEHEKHLQKFNEARTRLYTTEPIFRTTELTENYKKAFLGICAKPDPNYIDHLRNVLSTVGFSCIDPKMYGMNTGDAEALCATLELNQLAWGAMTVDSDYHVYGGRYAITEFEQIWKAKSPDQPRVRCYTVQVRSLDSILLQTGLDFNRFKDLCILLGTDFNSNIRGMGPVKCWEAIQKYGNIITMSNYINVSTLNYPQVLSKFNDSFRQVALQQQSFDWVRFSDNARKILDQEGLIDYIDKMLTNRPQNVVGTTNTAVTDQTGNVPVGMQF
jgi:5'-3' exonuclease